MAGEASTARSDWEGFFRTHARDDIRALAGAYPEERSLYVDLLEVHRFDAALAEALFDDPDRYLQRAAVALRDLHDAFDRVNVRVENNPGLVRLDALRSRHVSELVTVEGVVDDVDAVEARADVAAFRCVSCGQGVCTRPAGLRIGRPLRCESCDATGSFELEHDRSRFVDVQRLSLASPADERDPDLEPRVIDVYLDDDLVTTVPRSERILATGVVRLDRLGEGNRFDFYLDAISVNDEPREARIDEDAGASDRLGDVIESRWHSVMDG